MLLEKFSGLQRHYFNFCTSTSSMSSSSWLSWFLLWFSSSLGMLGEVKLLSSPNLAFFFSPTKMRPFQRRQNLSDQVKFPPSLYFFFLQVNFVIEITISTPKFQGLSFPGEVKSPNSSPSGAKTYSTGLNPAKFGFKTKIENTVPNFGVGCL